MDFRFTNEYPVSKLDEIVSYLLGPRLWIPHSDYPDFLDWAERAHQELKKEQKRALVAVENNDIVGVTIYQRHKQHPDALEIKNLTVRPDKRGRYIASFLLRNSEIEGTAEFGSREIVCDAKKNNLPIRFFLERNHYNPIARADLYGKSGGEDIVFKKYV